MRTCFNAKNELLLGLSLPSHGVQEVQKLGVDLNGCRQRLEEAQRAEGRARVEAAGLAEGLSRAQRQLHLTR